jgi:transposase
MVVIGVDTHTRTHSAAAIDSQGRVLAETQVGASPYELRRLVRWIGAQGPERMVAVESARGLGLALTRVLLAAGERVVDVAPTLTAEGRRLGTRRGKDDPGDAIVVARIALRGERVPAVDGASLDDDLKLLVDARDQLVAEAGRVRNRLHALLLVMAPGYRDSTGALASKRALAAARRLALSARARDAVRCRLALAAVRRLRAIAAEISVLEGEIGALIELVAPANLLAVPGVGPLVAAKLLGETRGVGRFSSAAAFAAHAGVAPIPASSGTTRRHRLNRGGNRQLNRALFTIAMVQARWDPRACEYLARKRGEGKSPAEARRCLKRHLASVVYRAMREDTRAATERNEPGLEQLVEQLAERSRAPFLT